MTRLFRFLFFLLIFIGIHHHSILAQNYKLGLPFIRYYPTSEYKGGIQNWSISQNKYGLIYVANNFGVLEYDGSNWKIYSTSLGAKVRDVAIDNDGKIYVAGQGDFGYLFPNKAGELTYTSLADSLPSQYRNFDETWRVFLDTDRIIFGTFKQVFIYSKKGGIQIIEPEEAPENFFYINHRLYVNQLGTGLLYLEGKHLKALPGSDVLQKSRVSGMVSLSGGNLWICTADNGIYTYNGSNFTSWKGISARHPIAQSTINCAIRLRNGNFALGTQNNGLFILSPDGDIILHLNKTKGLNNRTILNLFEDSQNNLWLGHNNGITFIELGMPFTYINEQVGLPGTGYTGYLDGERLYLGTNNGLFYKDFNSGSNEDYRFVENTEGQVYSIKKIQDHLLMGHHRGGFEIKGLKATQFSGTPGAWTYLRLRDQPGYIIEGTYNGLLLHKEVNGQLIFQHPIEGFYESSRVMEQDENGDLWMTHGYKGVFRLRLNDDLDSITSVKYYGTEAGLPSKLLINVFRIRNRLVFTTQNKIYRFDESSQRFVIDSSFKDFFDNEPITALAEDPFQNIYYLSANEMGVLENDVGQEFQAKHSVFNKLKDMLNDDLQNISILSANQVLYGAKEGFILYDARGNDITQHDFQILIREVRLTGDNSGDIFNGFFIRDQEIVNEQPDEYMKEIPYKNNSLQISYSAAYIDGLEKTEYKYWLENSEKSWSNWTPKIEKEYTNLREGKYTFHVKARNIYGKETSPIQYSFVILPPWYRTHWAYLLYGSIVITSLFISFYLFDKKHKREKKVMSLQQERKLHQKETELETIAKASASEIQHLKNEKLKSEIESKNKELATSTMHLVNKNGFIDHIKGNLAAISKRSKNQEVKNELRKVIVTIDKNISEDDNWEQFSFHFDQVHGDFTRRLKEFYPNLSPQDMKLSAYLRMNLSTKEMAHLLNISIRGVEISRYRLRKKLSLERSENLQEFILKF